MEKTDLLRGIDWLGHASFRIRDRITIYIDPWELKGRQPAADLVLITHEHHDHCSPQDVKKILATATVVVATRSCEPRLRQAIPSISLRTAAPGLSLTERGVMIDAVPAYNPRKRFHPREAGVVGYRIQLPGRSIYHMADTDDTPECRAVTADVLLVPVGGTYTMTGVEAAAVANAIRPGVAVPMHWGKIVGGIEDARAFQAAATVPVAILEPVR